MRLVKVELTRLRWRRAVLLLLAAAVVLPIVFAASTAWSTRPFSDAEISEARAQLERDRASILVEVDNCVAHPRRYDLPKSGKATDGELRRLCEEWMGVANDDLEMYLWRPMLSIDTVLEETAVGVGVFMVILALLMGTTFAGADWSSGSMSNQLLFESRRSRLWLAKAAAVLVGAALLAVVGMAVFWLLISGLAAMRDVSTSGTLDDVLVQICRTTGLAAGAAVIGYAVTMLFRSTVATLGLTLALAIGGSMLINLIPIDDPTPWMFHANALAILQDGFTYYHESALECDEFECYGSEKTLGLWHGVAYFWVLLVAASGLSLASFRRRDVP